MPTEDMGLPRGEALQGLSSAEAKKRLEKFGPNVLPERPPPSNFKLIISQLKSPLVYVLLAAGLVTIALRHLSDAAIIFFAVFVNTSLGFIQERRASRALHALKKLIHPTAEVLRDGKIKNIDVSEVVQGDITILNRGDKVPADGKLIEANRLYLSEAILTGESASVAKEEKDKVFMGTIVAAGRGRMIVETTGAATEIGKIAESIQAPSEDTPLKKQLANFSKQLSILVAFLVSFVFIAGLVGRRDPVEMFTTSVALAVSAIPEGLLVALTVVLAIGMQRILARRGLVRNLVSAETLGGVTIICVDKTGTLTLGKMQVVDVVGDEEQIALQAIVANDLDDPILVAAYDWAKEKIRNPKSEIRNHPRLDSLPFSPSARFFASLNYWNRRHNMIFVNGAPEFLMQWSNLNKDQESKIKNEIEKLTKSGKRLVGLARREVSFSKKKLAVKDVKSGLEWIGLLAFSDPVRPGVAKAMAATKRAGLNLLVITGDYAQTAVSVMRELGIEVEEEFIVHGEELERITTESLAKKLADGSGIKLFARTTPEQKVKIVEALKRNGEVVAMMGDGVNDAPALMRADIGIVVGEATDVAKESADLVLLDSNFTTIVAAIEEGRGIFDNIRKIILYLMSDAFSEIVAVVGAIILGLPLPVTAAQILWINLVSDGFPNLALTVDPKASNIMRRKPRNPQEKVVTSWMRMLILIVSVTGGILALSLFIYFYKTSGGNLALSQSVAFATLGVNSLVYVFSIRTLKEPFWRQNPFANKWLNVAVVGGLGLQLTPFIFGGVREFFGLVALSLTHWLYVFTAAFAMFILIEAAKVVFRKRLAKDLEIS